MKKAMYKINDIEKVWPDWYKKDSDLSFDEQKFIWENTELPIEEWKWKSISKMSFKSFPGDKTNDDVLNGSAYGGHKLDLNSLENLTKPEAILKLKKCTYLTSPKILASYLELIFNKWPSHEGHWLWIAQHYTPKTINSLIQQILKQTTRGEINIKNPSAYFTDAIKHKLKRKKFRSSSGGHKRYLKGESP